RQGVENMLDIFKKEMRVAMTLTSNRTIADIKPEALVDLSKL
ncbi:L-lactate dehydrogenase (cytochrome), partial [Haemophilus influenzae]